MGPELNCIYCFSKNIYGVQLRKNKSSVKQIYKCKDCKRRFTPNNGFKKFRYPIVMIKTALELLNKGSSLGEISSYLNRNFKTKITRKTIFDWKRRFL